MDGTGNGSSSPVPRRAGRLVRRLVGFRFPWRLGVLPLPSLIREEAAEARADGGPVVSADVLIGLALSRWGRPAAVASGQMERTRTHLGIEPGRGAESRADLPWDGLEGRGGRTCACFVKRLSGGRFARCGRSCFALRFHTSNRNRASSRTSAPDQTIVSRERATENPAAFRSDVLRTARIRSERARGQLAGSSARTIDGARPAARAGSLPMHRTRAPVSRSSIIALCVLSQILNLSGSCSIDGPANAKMWSNTIRACPNDDATQRTSPRRMASGPEKRGGSDPRHERRLSVATGNAECRVARSGKNSPNVPHLPRHQDQRIPARRPSVRTSVSRNSISRTAFLLALLIAVCSMGTPVKPVESARGFVGVRELSHTHLRFWSFQAACFSPGAAFPWRMK